MTFIASQAAREDWRLYDELDVRRVKSEMLKRRGTKAKGQG